MYNRDVRDGKIVVCINNKPIPQFCNGEDNHLLIIGDKYTVDKEVKHTWFSTFTLKEFPGKTFNSVLFVEA